jgi:hypothetical protein
MTPGLTLTLDYGHFVAAGAAEQIIEPMLIRSRHAPCSGGAGFLQASEYVWSEWQGCDQADNLTETVALRNVLAAALQANGETH